MLRNEAEKEMKKEAEKKAKEKQAAYNTTLKVTQ